MYKPRLMIQIVTIFFMKTSVKSLAILMLVVYLLFPVLSYGHFLFPVLKAEAGYITVHKKNKLFYLLVASSTKTIDAPLVIYLAGGPGASSISTAFLENGPWLLDKPFVVNQHNNKLKKNQWAFNRLANIVYLDQPRYTGYSYGKGRYVTSIRQAGQDFLLWLNAFFKKYPYYRHRRLYLAGESFAGQYIPEFSHQIVNYNKLHSKQAINLVGIFVQAPSLANDVYGLDVSPNYQMIFLCQHHLLTSKDCNPAIKSYLWNTLAKCISAVAFEKQIDPAQVKISDIYGASNSNNKSCQNYIRNIQLIPEIKHVKVPISDAFPASIRGKVVPMAVNKLEFSTDSKIRHYLSYSPNPYNMTLYCQASGGFPPWCYNNDKMTSFFNDTTVRSWIAKNRIPQFIRWKFADFWVALAMELKRNYTPLTYYTEALKKGIKVVFVLGKDDWQINYLSAQVLADKIFGQAYDHQSLFDQLPANPDTLNRLFNEQGQPIGEYQQKNKFTFAQINHAGHMVGMDQRNATYQLFNLLLTEQNRQ